MRTHVPSRPCSTCHPLHWKRSLQSTPLRSHRACPADRLYRLHLKRWCTQPDSHACTTLADGPRPVRGGRGRAWQSMVTQGVEPSAKRGAPGAPAPFSRPWHTVVFRFQIRTVLSCAPPAHNKHCHRGELVRAHAQRATPRQPPPCPGLGREALPARRATPPAAEERVLHGGDMPAGVRRNARHAPRRGARLRRGDERVVARRHAERRDARRVALEVAQEAVVVQAEVAQRVVGALRARGRGRARCGRGAGAGAAHGRTHSAALWRAARFMRTAAAAARLPGAHGRARADSGCSGWRLTVRAARPLSAQRMGPRAAVPRC